MGMFICNAQFWYHKKGKPSKNEAIELCNQYFIDAILHILEKHNIIEIVIEKPHIVLNPFSEISPWLIMPYMKVMVDKKEVKNKKEKING